jgi:hypothetical protein
MVLGSTGGDWTYVIVDDWFPVDENGDLMYARCKDPQEVWVALLEKAFCKLHTCYEMCDGGISSEAVFSFFGGVSGRFMLKKQHRRDPKRYFKLLKNARDKGWLLTTGFVVKPGDVQASAGKCGEAVCPSGLVGGHAYSVLRVVEAHGQQLVCCRNPWGSGEWQGKWSDNNSHGEWTAEMKKACGYVGLDDGKFWMSIEDFVMHSSGAEYARTFGPNWKKVTFYKFFKAKPVIAVARESYAGKKKDELNLSKGDVARIVDVRGTWWKGVKQGSSEEGWFPDTVAKFKEREIMRFDLVGTPNEGLEGPMTCVILLMQPSSHMLRKYKKRSDGLNYKDLSYGQLQLVVVGPDGEVAIKRQGRKRCVWGEVSLPGGGLWRIYALSLDGVECPCTLRCYAKDGTVAVKQKLKTKFSEMVDLLYPSDTPRPVNKLNLQPTKPADTKSMEDMVHELDLDGDDSDDHDEGISQDQLEYAEDLREFGIDKDELVSLEMWRDMLQLLDLDDEEGMDLYDRIKEEQQAKGKPVTDAGFKLLEFLEELNIQANDRESLEEIQKAMTKAKEMVEKGISRIVDPKAAASSARTMFDKVVKALDQRKLSAEDAWRITSQGIVKLSKAERHQLEKWEGRQKEFIETTAKYILEPPVVNSTAGQTVCNQHCSAEVARIIKECNAKGMKYTDPDWDVHKQKNAVLYVDKALPGYDCTVTKPAGFKRLSDIVKNSGAGAMGGLFGSFGGAPKGSKPVQKPMVFKGKVKAGDIVQGQIGTCFLLGAMGAIASHREESVERLFIKFDVDVGVYGIRFNNGGDWVSVIVDDWFPVDEYGDLMYARCKDPQEVWVPLLEKAYCKLNTCYEMCDGGISSEAVLNFFGGVSGRFMIKKQHRRNPKRYFKLLKNAVAKGWLLTTGFVIRPGDVQAGAGKCGEAVCPSGLVGGHAYSLLRVVEAHGQQLVCCRNPWGSGEWQGKWSDNNSHGEWTAEMKKACGYTNVDDGKFWMSIEDFVMHSSGAEYARTYGPNWKKVTFYKFFKAQPVVAVARKTFSGRKKDELNLSKGDEATILDVKGNWWKGVKQGSCQEGWFPDSAVKFKDREIMRFDLVGTPNEGLEGPMTCVILLTQPTAQILRRYKERDDGENYKDLSYGQLQLAVVGPDGSVACKRIGRKRCVWAELSLPGGGLWRIYALSLDGKECPCTIRCYVKDGTVEVKQKLGTMFAEMANILYPD